MSVRRLTAALLMLLSAGLKAQVVPTPWVVGEVVITGSSLTVEPDRQTVPLNLGTVVNTHFGFGGGAPPASWRVRGDLTGPAFTGSQQLETIPGQPLQIPPLPVAGVYLLKNIRLTSGDATVSQATPSQVEIDASNVVVSQVTSRPMTADEIQQSGIAINENDYKAVRYSVGMVINSKVVNLDFPVLFDKTDLLAPPIVLSKLHLPGSPPLPNVLPRPNDHATEDLDGLDLDLEPFAVEHDGDGGGGGSLSGLLIFPNRITFLNQFFVIGIVLQNGAPGGSPLQLVDLTSTINFPSGSGFTLKQTLPPLVAGRLPIRNAGPDGELGTADDVAVLTAGVQGQGEFDVETPNPGTYTVTIDFQGVLKGLPSGQPAPIKGKASGVVVVRDPTFHVTFAHPAVIRTNEEYTLKVTITNTSTVTANDVSLGMGNITGATLLTGQSTNHGVGNLGPGENATVTYRLVALRTGQVTATSAAGTGGTGGTIVLTAGVGAAGIPLSPDTLILPPVVSEQLPEDVVDAGLDFLGLGWSLATAPPNSRPANLAPVSEGMVRRQANELTKLARFVKIANGNGYTSRQALSEMALLWSGAGTSDSAFDALRRIPREELDATPKGQKFAEVLGAHLAGPGEGVLDAHRAFAQSTRVLAPHFSAALDSSGTATPAQLYLTNAQGRILGDVGARDAKRDLPWGESYPLGAGKLLTVGKLAAEDAFDVHVNGEADGTVDLSVLAPLSGGIQWVTFERVEVRAGSRARVSFAAGQDTFTLFNDVAGNGVEVPVSSTRSEAVVLPPLTPLGALQDLMADDVGRAVSVFFNRPVEKAPSESAANFSMNTRDVLGAFRQDDERVIEVRAKSRISPFAVPSNTITISGQQSMGDGLPTPMDPTSVTLTVKTSLTTPGGVVHGVVYGEDGIPLPGAKVWLWENEADLLKKYRELDLDFPAFKITQETVTDAAGAFTFDYVLKSGQNFKIVARDPASSREAVVQAIIGHAGEILNIALFIRPRGKVAGKVFNPDGSPAAGALVTATEGTSLEFVQAKTDAAGSYLIERAPIGTLQLQAEAAGGMHAEGTGRLNSAGDTLAADFHLYNLPVASVIGVVKDANHVPLAGAVVAISRDSYTITSAYTNAEGAFLLSSIPPGDYGFTVYLPVTFRPRYSQIVELTGNTTKNLQNIILPADETGFGTVTGHVFAGDHVTSIGAAQIYITNNQGGILASTQTDEHGSYGLTHVPLGTWTVTAYVAATRKAVTGTVTIAYDGQSVGLPLYFPALGIIQGTVYKPTANGLRPPASNVTVYIGDRTVTTNGSGQYFMTDVPVGTYGVTAARDLDDIGMTGVNLGAAGVTATAPDITMLGRGDVTVHVFIRGVGMADQPVMVPVTLGTYEIKKDPGPAPGLEPLGVTGVSDATTGAVTFTNIIGTNAFVSACSPFNGCGFKSLVVKAGLGSPANDVTVYLEPTGMIQGTVFAPDGVTHIPYARVTLSSPSLPPRTIAADAQGHFDFDLVPLEQVTLKAVDNITGRFGIAKGVVTSSKPGDWLRLDVTLLGEGTVRGTVFADDGTGARVSVAGVNVTLKGSAELPERREVTDGAGQFLMANVVEGDYALEAIDLHRVFPLSGRATIQVAKGATTNVNIDLASTGAITGTLRKVDHSTAVDNAQVTLGIGTQDQGFALTGADGRFGFTGVPLNVDLSLYAYDARSGRSASGTARLASANQAIDVPLTLNAVGALSGKVSAYGGGEAIPNARIETYVRGAGNLIVTADAGGIYLMPGLPAGTYQLHAVDIRNGASAYRESQISDDGVTVEHQDLVMPPFGSVVGTVIRHRKSPSDSVPVDGAIVRLDATHVMATDPAGNFHFDGVAAGQYTIIAADPLSPDGGKVTVTVAANETAPPASIEFIGLGTVHGKVTDAANNPVEGFPVSLENINVLGRDYAYVTGSATDGSFTFVRQRAGHIQLNAYPPSGNPDPRRGSVEGDLLPGLDTPLELVIKLSPSGSVRGLVVDATLPAPVPLYQALVTLTSVQPAGSWTVATTSAGGFFFPLIPLDPGCLCNSFNLFITGPRGGHIRASGNLSGAGNTTNMQILTLDEQPPLLLSTVPADQAADVAVDASFSALFSEPVDPASVTAETFKLVKDGTTVVIAGLRTLEGGGTRIRFTPAVPLIGQAGYTLTLTGGLLDLNGNPLGGNDRIVRFRTYDNVPPFVTSSYPTDQAVEIDPAAVPFIVFSEPVSITGSVFTISSSAGPIAGTLTQADDNTKLIFVPSPALQQNQLYTITVAGVKDAAGNLLIPFTAKFATPDLTPPTVSIAAPAEVQAGTAYNWIYQADDAVSVRQAEYHFSGGIARDFTATYPLGSMTLTLPGGITAPALPDGTLINISARATDAGGHVVDAAPRQSVIYNLPTASIQSPAYNSFWPLGATVTVQFQASYLTSLTAIDRAEVWVNGAVFPATSSDAVHFTSSVTMPATGSATTLVARAYTTYGKSADSQPYPLRLGGPNRVHGKATRSGVPVGGASIKLYRGGGFERSTFSDAAGDYEFVALNDGNYIVTTRDDITRFDLASPALAAVGTVDLEYNPRLVPLGSVRVTVKETNSSLVNNAPVTLTQTQQGVTLTRTGTTSGNGEALLSDVAGGIAFLVSASNPITGNHGSATGTMDPAGQETPATVNLVVGGILSGVVTKSNGTPFAGLKVYAYDTVSHTATTGDDGTYVFDNIALNVAPYVQCQNLGYSTNWILLPKFISSGQEQVKNFTMPVVASVRVHSVDAAGYPLPGNSLAYRDSYSNYWGSIGTLDASGVKVIPTVVEGPYGIEVYASSPPYAIIGTGSGAVQVQDQGQTIDIIAPPQVSGVVSGKVTLGDGVTPLRDTSQHVDYINADTGEQLASVNLDANGNFSFNPAPAVSHEFILRISYLGVTTETRGAFSTSGEPLTRNLILPLAPAEIHLTYANLSPVAGASVYLRALNGNIYYPVAINDAMGIYQFVTPAGDLSFAATAPIELQDNRTLNVPDVTSLHHFDIALPEDGTVEVLVTDLSDNPLPGLQIRMKTEADAYFNYYSKPTNASGLAWFHHAALNRYTVQACMGSTQICISGVADLLAAGGGTVRVTLQTPLAGQVSGTALDANGHPLSDLFVEYATRYSSQFSYVPVDGAGLYATPILPYGNYQFRVCAMPILCGLNNLDLEQSSATLSLTLPDHGTLDAAVSHENGAGYQGTLSFTYTSWNPYRQDYSFSADPSGHLRFPRAPTGTFQINACATPLNCGVVSDSLAKGGTSSPTLVIPDPADVEGVVLLKDGMPALGATVRLSVVTNDFITGVYLETTTDAVTGHYRFAGRAGPGSYFISACVNCVSGTSVGQNFNIGPDDATVMQNLRFPYDGKVTVTVTDSNGNSIKTAYVSMQSSDNYYGAAQHCFTNLNYPYNTICDNTYIASNVSPGHYLVKVQAHPGGQTTNFTTLAELDLGVDEHKSITVILPRTGNISGQVVVNGLPVANAGIDIENQSLLDSWFGGSASSNGSFSFGGLPAGTYDIFAWTSGWGTVIARARVTIPSGGGTVQVTAWQTAGIVNYPVNLDGADGFRYDVSWCGVRESGGTTDGSLTGAYDWSGYLTLGLAYMPCADTADTLLSGGREVSLGGDHYSGLHVTRRIYSPAAGGFIRYLEQFSNPTASDITLPVKNQVSDMRGFQIEPASVNNRYLVLASDGATRPIVGEVFGGPGASAAPSFNGDSASWTVTVPAGQTVALLHYSLQRHPDNAAGAQAASEALMHLTDPDALNGLSAADKAQIVNFLVP